MFFKRLEILGFKSFANKTTIEFTPGATIIVGPNGCGKSNILDSIRWVLGEQRARAIRGLRMGDVIFNGSASVKALNLARVSMILNNEDCRLGLDASEIQLGRQLLRTGESEYLINRMPCRMRSVQELLTGTGAGVNAYSVLEQGRVDQIVTAKPDERRVLFEEAAGISLYRQRKAETLRKLERTEADLARLADIIREVKGQSISLKRQANRALRFKVLDAELTQLEMALVAISFACETLNRDKEKSRLEKETAALDGLAQKIDSLESLLDKEREGMEDLEAEIRALQQQLAAEREAVSQCERAIALFDERRGAYDRQARQLSEEVDAATAHAAKVEAQTEEILAKCEELAGEVQRLEALRDERLEAMQVLRRNQESQRAELRERQKELDQLRERQRRRENEARLSLSRCEAIESQIRKAREQLAASQEQRTGLAQRLEEKSAEVARLDALIAERRGRLERDLRAHAEEEETLGGLLSDLESTIQVHSECNSRLLALKELEERFEGYGGGVREVMQAAADRHLRGVRGVLPRLIRSRSEYETAIEIALGPSIEDIVTDTAQDAARAIEYLRVREKGRARFLPLDAIRVASHDGQFDAIVRRAGVIEVAARLVECEPWLQPVVDAILGGAVLVEDLDVALGLRLEGCDARYVSLNGEVVSPEGAIAGGDMLPLRLLGREREMDELAERVAELKTREDALREAVYSRREMLRAGGESVNVLREEVHEDEVEMARSRNEREQIARALGDLARRLDEHESSLAELEGELAHTRGHIDQVQRDARQMADQADQMARDIDAGASQVEGIEQALAAASDALNQAGMELTSARERHSATRDRAAALQGESERVRRNAEQKSAQIGTLKEQIAATEREQQLARERLEQIRAKRDAIEAKAAGQSELRERHARAMEDKRQDVQVMMRDRNQMQNRVHEADLQLQQANLRIEQLNEQAREKFRKTAEDVAADVLELRRKLAERKEREAQGAREVAAPVAALAPTAAPGAEGEESEPDLAAQQEELLFELPEDPNDLRGRIRPLREQIARLGPINTVAIEEYEQLRERYVSLQGQEKDMTEARETLIKTIKTIDKTSREMFEEAFNAVDANFQEMFRRLFSGGKAYLKLDEGAEDVLEAGVEIFAQPPGKQIGNLAMMSGGEKALTAIALLFAIFQYRPSPFCVLDEIDAPLDDANCLRLVDMLREFTKTVQFIIITHNKITMQLADTIYGVTMDEPGVSRILTIPRHLLKDPDDVARHARAQSGGNGGSGGNGKE